MDRLKKLIASGLLFTGVAMLCIQDVQAAIVFRAASTAGIRQATISYRASGNVASAASGNITPTLSGSSLNYFLICLVEQHDNVVISFPAGWTQLYSISTTTTHRASAYYKMAAAAETNPLITHPGGNSIIAQCSTFRGVDPVKPLDVAYAAQYAASSTSVTSGSVTTLTANDMMLFVPHVANNPTLAAPTGAGGVTWTQRFYSTTAQGLRSAVGLYTGTKTTAGAVGPITSTLALASENHGVLLALHNGSTLSIKVPAGTVAGDVMIAAIATTPSSVPIAAPAGWTLIQAVTQATATSNRVSTYYRVATASEPASYTWTLSTAHTGAAGGIASYSGVDNITPIDVSAGAATPSSLNHTAPSITTSMANEMLVTVHEYASASSWGPPGGMIERVDIASRSASANGVTLEMNEFLLGAAGATGAKTASAAANADTGGTVSIALRPVVSAPHHIRIEHYGGACMGTSAPAQITIKACANAACTAPHYTASDVTGINLAPTGTGYTWTPANPQTITAASGGINNGITLARSTGGTATLAITGTPSPAPGNAYECYNVNTGVSGDCNLVFATTDVFIFNVPNHTADSSQVVTLTACKGAFANTTRSVKFWSTYLNPATGTLQGKVAAGTGNADCATGYSALGASSATPTTLSLAFGPGTTPQTTFSLCYPDAGQVQVDARYDGSAANTPPDAGTVILGNSRFKAAPHHFTLSNINCVGGCSVVANPGAANAAGAAFMKAGNPFSLTVTAYNTHNAVTSNFGKETTPEGVSLTAAMIADPDLTTAGVISGAFNAFSNGVATGNAFSFDEVGIMTLTARLAGGNYLGSGIKEITTPATGNIGRFIPDHFTVTTNPDSPIVTQADFPPQTLTTVDPAGASAPATVIPVTATTGFNVGDKVRIPGAGAGGSAFTATLTAIDNAAVPPTFTLNAATGTTLAGGENVIDEWGSYMGEQFNAQFALDANELNGATTNNYQGAYAKLNPAAAGNPLGLGAMDAAGPTYNLALDTSLAATGSFTGGSAAITAPLAVMRGASAVGPYNAVKIGIAPADTDGVKMGAYNLGVSSAAADHTSIMDPLVQDVTALRYGRMKIANAHGSELLPLPVALTAQYWNGATYVTSTDDNNTVLAIANIVLGNYQRKAGDTWTTSAALPNATAVGGGWVVTLARPTGTFSGKGSVDITTTAPAYLPNPPTGGRATFGVYKGARDFIYLRENY